MIELTISADTAGSVEEIEQRLAQKAVSIRAIFKKIDRALKEAQIAVTAQDSNVGVTVDGLGHLLSIMVEPSVVRSDRARHLGKAIVAVITEARSKADELRVLHEQDLLDKNGYVDVI